MLFEKRGDDVKITEKLISLLVGRFGIQVINGFLEKRGDEVKITEKVVKAAAGNEESGELVMSLLLERRPGEIVASVSPSVCLAAATCD